MRQMIVGENALNQEQGAAPPAAHTVSPPAAPLPSAPPNASESAPISSRSTLARLAIPLFAVLTAFGFIALATLRWDEWVGNAVIQTTNDAYAKAELTRLSSRVAGEVLTVAVKDFQRVKAGDLLVQIDPADYQAQVAQAEAGVAAAQAALDNLSNQVELQYATIAQAEAQLVSAAAQEVEARQEQERQQSLSQTESGTRQKLEQATAAYAKAQADVRASRAVIAAQRHQLEVLSGTKKQRAADLEGAKATLAAAKLRLGYTKIVAPFDGVTGERLVQPGDYVNIGSNLINVVPQPLFAVAAVLLGSFLANFDSRLTSVGLPDLRGAFSLGFDEGAWLSTAGIGSQIFIAPAVAWLATVFGLRRVLGIPSLVYAVISLAIPFVHDYTALIALSIMHGMLLGTFVPATLMIIFRNLPIRWWLPAIAIYSIRVGFSLDTSTSLVGFYVDHWGWQWLYWQGVVIAPLMGLMVYLGTPHEPVNKELLRDADWGGMLLLGTGVSMIYAGLDQGNRLDWLGSGTVMALLLGGGVLCVAFLIN